VFQNEDKTCPERHGGEAITKLYIDSSQPVPLGISIRHLENKCRLCFLISFFLFSIFDLRHIHPPLGSNVVFAFS
jgi:hypothetical protein